MFEVINGVENVVKFDREDVFDGIPVLKITFFDEEGGEHKIGFLSEWRQCGFQVSGTAKGEGDRGSFYQVDLVQMCKNLDFGTTKKCMEVMVEKVIRDAFGYAKININYDIKKAFNCDCVALNDIEEENNKILNNWYAATIYYLASKKSIREKNEEWLASKRNAQ